MHVHGHEHVCQVIDDQGGLIGALREFLAGLDRREGVFVHRYTEDQAWALLAQAGPAQDLKAAGRLRVVHHRDAFEGRAPRIHHDHVAEVVQQQLEDAAARGHGLSILADASHAYISSGRAQEWFAFENWLGARLQQDVALVCLYWAQDLEQGDCLGGMMRTHLARLAAPIAAH